MSKQSNQRYRKELEKKNENQASNGKETYNDRIVFDNKENSSDQNTTQRSSSK